MKTIYYVLGLLGLWLVTDPRSAHAASARRDSVVVIVRGDASEHDRKVVDAALRTAVQGAGWTIVVPLAKAAAAVAECVDAVGPTPWDCVTAATKPGTGVFLVASVLREQRADGAAMTRVMVIVVGYRPATIDSQQFYCELCTDAKLRDGMGGLVKSVLTRIVLSAGETGLRVTSQAEFATVVVDGEAVGKVNKVIAVLPGPHHVSVRRDGVASTAQTITIAEGDTADLTIELPTLVAAQPAKGQQAGPLKTDGGQGGRTAGSTVMTAAPSRLWPGVLIGAGTGLVVVSGYTLWRGQAESAPYRYPNATAIGLGTGVAGIGLAVAGIYWWRRGTAKSTSMPTAQLQLQRVVLGWAGTF